MKFCETNSSISWIKGSLSNSLYLHLLIPSVMLCWQCPQIGSSEAFWCQPHQPQQVLTDKNSNDCKRHFWWIIRHRWHETWWCMWGHLKGELWIWATWEKKGIIKIWKDIPCVLKNVPAKQLKTHYDDWSLQFKKLSTHRHVLLEW